MDFEFGKSIDSFILKKNLDKAESISEAKKNSTFIEPGLRIDTCPICADEKRDYLQTIYRFEYYECSNCGVVYLANMPTDEQIEKIYNSQYYTNCNRKLYASDNITGYRKKNIAEPKVEYIMPRLTTSQKNWLDIGCGIGEILSVVTEKGYAAVGIETNDMEIEYGKTKFGVEILKLHINEENIETLGNYGVISLFGLLEHVTDPHAVIGNLARLQKKNDNLIIEVPHFPSISAYSQIAFPDHVNRMMLPPLHLFLFSLTSLQLLLEKYSYRIIHVWYFGQDFYEFISTLAFFAPQLNDSEVYQKLSSMTNGLQQVIDQHRLSDEVLIIAKKLQ